MESQHRPASLLKLVPTMTFGYVALHLGCLAVFYLPGEVGRGIVICAASYVARMLILSAAYHRYFAHRSFSTSRPVQFLLGLAGLTTMQNGPLWWAATHRAHHRDADTPDDLHSPRHHGFFYAHSLWFLDSENQPSELARSVGDLARYRELWLLEHPLTFALVNAAYAGGLFALWGPVGLVWGFFGSTVVLLHVTHMIQSVSHSVGGYRNFETSDDSRNHVWVGWLSLGEWHNNHHRFPSSARQGFAWWELDPTWMALRLLQAGGVTWNLRDGRRSATVRRGTSR